MTAAELRAKLSAPNTNDVYSALIAIGKDNHRELEPDVAAFLDHPEPELRGAAIRVLAFYWGSAAWGGRAEQMALTETDDDARAVAIMAWCALHRETRDREVLRRLLAILEDRRLSDRIRAAAYNGMMVVAGLPGAERAKAATAGPIDPNVDWALVAKMLDGTDLAISNPSVAPTPGVRMVTYDHGEPQVPSALYGRIVVTFNGETGLVKLIQHHGPKVRGWMATLPTETWTNLLVALDRYQFPRAPVIITPPAPGSLSTTISWERKGQLERVVIAGRTADYRDVNILVWSVVSQMAPGLLSGDPKKWESPGSSVDAPFAIDGEVVPPPR